MSRRRDRRRKQRFSRKTCRLERKVSKRQRKYAKVSKAVNKETLLDKAGKFETCVRFERRTVTDRNGNTTYSTAPHIALREKKYHGHGVLHTAVSRLDKFEGDMPSVERTLRNMTPTTRRGRIARNTLLVGTTALKRTGKTALNAGLTAENIVVSGGTKIAKKAVSSAADTVKYKLKSKADEALEPYSVYLKTAEYLPSPKEIKQYIRQKKIYKLETSKTKLLKSEKDLSKVRTAEAKNDLKTAKREFRAEKKRAKHSCEYRHKTREIHQEKREVRASRRELRQAKSELKQAKRHERQLTSRKPERILRNCSKITCTKKLFLAL